MLFKVRCDNPEDTVILIFDFDIRYFWDPNEEKWIFSNKKYLL